MQTPERLNFELRDAQGNIVAATADRGTAELIERIISRLDIYDCSFAYSHRAWFPCDFSGYFNQQHFTPEVVIEGTRYLAEKKEIEVMEGV